MVSGSRAQLYGFPCVALARSNSPHPACPVLPTERHTQHRPVYRQIVDLATLLEFVVEIAPGGDHLAPGIDVPDARRTLPSEIGVARSDIHVVRNEPFAVRAEASAA